MGEIEDTPLGKCKELSPEGCPDPIAFLAVINNSFVVEESNKSHRIKTETDEGEQPKVWIRKEKKTWKKENDAADIQEKLEVFKFFIKDQFSVMLRKDSGINESEALEVL